MLVYIIVFESTARFESLLFKLEVLDHKARERAGVITPTLGSPIPVLLQLDAATEVPIFTKLMGIIVFSTLMFVLERRIEMHISFLLYMQALLALSIRYAVIQSVYNYWKEKVRFRFHAETD